MNEEWLTMMEVIHARWISLGWERSKEEMVVMKTIGLFVRPTLSQVHGHASDFDTDHVRSEL
jgi:hypothetical protein